MKTSSKIFFGFWGAALLLIVGFIAALSSITRAWVSPDGRQLRDATHLTGPWKDQAVAERDFTSLRLSGAFDVTWERAADFSVTVSAPGRFPDAFAARREGSALVLANRLGGRFSELALRVRIKSPSLTAITAGRSLKLKLAGNPGPSFDVSGRGAVWIEGACPEPVERLSVRSEGLTVLQLKECRLKVLELEVQGKVMVDAEVTDSLEGSVHGDGRINLKGAPARSRLFNQGKVRVVTE